MGRKSKEAKTQEAQVAEQESFFDEGEDEVVTAEGSDEIDDLWNGYLVQPAKWHLRTSKIQALVTDIKKLKRDSGKGEFVRVSLDNIKVLEGDETSAIELPKQLNYTYKIGGACMWTYALRQFESCGAKKPSSVVGKDVIFEAACVNFLTSTVSVGSKINPDVKGYQVETMVPTVIVEA